MTSKCKESISPTSVTISCSTSKCILSRTDTAHHITDIHNGRPGSLYAVEVLSTTLNGNFLSFNGQPKSLTVHPIVSRNASASPTPINLIVIRGPGTEEILTTVDFYDATQRIGNGMYIEPKETYNIDYEMDLI
jgi:hypothetical protein